MSTIEAPSHTDFDYSQEDDLKRLFAGLLRRPLGICRRTTRGVIVLGKFVHQPLIAPARGHLDGRAVDIPLGNCALLVLLTVAGKTNRSPTAYHRAMALSVPAAFVALCLYNQQVIGRLSSNVYS